MGTSSFTAPRVATCAAGRRSSARPTSSTAPTPLLNLTPGHSSAEARLLRAARLGVPAAGGGNDHAELGDANPYPNLPLPLTCGYGLRGSLLGISPGPGLLPGVGTQTPGSASSVDPGRPGWCSARPAAQWSHLGRYDAGPPGRRAVRRVPRSARGTVSARRGTAQPRRPAAGPRQRPTRPAARPRQRPTRPAAGPRQRPTRPATCPPSQWPGLCALFSRGAGGL